jgi:uncharacterized RDD family membrane protein YckC
LTESTPAIDPTPQVRYATFTRRFRALVIDDAIIAGLCIAVFFLGDAFRGVAGATHVTWLLMLAVLLLYEPLLITRRGATAGHSMARIQVVDATTGRWPSFGRAFVRYLVKLVLGVASFFTMALSRRHQAVHDMITHTTVQVAPTAAVEFHVERADEPDIVMPSRVRRFAVIVVYLVGVFIVYGLSVSIADSTGCVRDQRCSAGTWVALRVIGWAWLALSGATIIAGWRGMLVGARRRRLVSSDMAVV